MCMCVHVCVGGTCVHVFAGGTCVHVFVGGACAVYTGNDERFMRTILILVVF